MNTRDPIIVALDFDDERAAEALVDRLGEHAVHYKIGLELLTAAGPGLARRLAADGNGVFMDLKLFEIPNSVAGAVRACGRLGASMVTVHASGGPGILTAAVEAARDFPGLQVIALTVVTSMTDADLASVGVASGVGEQVERLAALARDCGCDGVVASPGEAGELRALLGPEAVIVTPGVSVSGASGEHARTGGPGATVRAGATHIVLGRGVTRAADPVAVLAEVRAELS
ncbi:orotidine-5'-phosphate decarboxylase [Phytomonospora endophytica]|uniref:Orotidine 5'-phosphate decarboxylase n=1 Tax=Phytomonospora endophytica TaxID=714109 RepID=A0A841FJD4_9ACTN|nr:orotidine-5'-phosphate decarboxylase [Phytomonospora endophytica]MBB6033948.1 orotidine-5'-phosphate decarboxylase [Phytomonospora endophytica]GIG64531.1 orotidine 5'-phosphate decarboxylase [Phytomonospora endophytica]